MDSQSKSDLIFYSGLALVIFLLWKKNANTAAVTWQVDPATGNLMPVAGGQSQAPLLTQIATATSAPLVSAEIANNSSQGSSVSSWQIDPVTGLLMPPGSAPGASGSW